MPQNSFLLHLPRGRDGGEVDRAMRHTIANLSTEFVRSITRDQGKERTRHVDSTIDTGVAVYFCDPHSRQQRHQ
jgi:IS30 family transposase